MTKFLKISAAVVALAAAASPVYAQSSATTSANATTRIIQAISISKTADMAFGNVVKPSSGNGTYTIGNGADTLSVSGTGAAAASGTTSRAKFTVTGEGAQTFAITVPSTMTMTSGANNVTVNLTTAASTGSLSGSLGSSGTASVNVGGNFTIANTQASGDYTGSFNVTVAYN